MNTPAYLYEKGVFKIVDLGLGIEMEDSFTVPEQVLHIEEGREGLVPPFFQGL